MNRAIISVILISTFVLFNVDCLQNCISEPIFYQNVISHSRNNLTVQLNNSVIVDDIWSKNETEISCCEVPNISEKERGKYSKNV